MTYTQEAKDLYDAFQDAMGNWERTPFERLSIRETEAWQQATGNVARLQHRIDEAREEVREAKHELDEVRDEAAETEEELAKANRLIDRLKAFKPTVNFCVGECK